MKTLKMVVEFTYDAEIMHGDDIDGMQWFFDEILFNEKDLVVYSCEIGDDIAKLKVIEIL